MEIKNILDEQNFIKHFTDLEEMAELLRETTTKEKVHAWIQEWRLTNEKEIHNFPSVMDIVIVYDDTGIWVEKNLFLNKLRKVAVQVF